MIVGSAWNEKSIPFRITLSQAQSIIVDHKSVDQQYLNDLSVPVKLSSTRGTFVVATNFPSSSPIDSISLSILNGQDGTNCDKVCLVGASFTCKSAEALTESNVSLRGKNFVVLMDKIILFDGRVQLPAASAQGSYHISQTRSIIPWRQAILSLSACAEWNVYFSMALIGSILWVLSCSVSAISLIFAPFVYLSLSGRGRLSDSVRTLFRVEPRKHLSFFVNGWQAWSFCGAVLHGSEAPKYAMPSVFAKAFHDGGEGTSLPINLGEDECSTSIGSLALGWRGVSSKDLYLASDMFTAITEVENGNGLVLGFLTQKLQFGCIATNRAFDRLAVHISGDGVHILPGSTISTDWLALYNFDSTIDEPFRTYMAMSRDANQAKVGRQPNLLNNSPVPVGWCSWYHFFANISEKDLTNNLSCMKRMKEKNNLCSQRVGFNLFQIDDGYQNAWGDWATVNKVTFPSQSLYPIVNKVKAEGMVGGIWMAPFACDKHSEIAKKHPDWILRRKRSSTIANSGNCGLFLLSFQYLP